LFLVFPFFLVPHLYGVHEENSDIAQRFPCALWTYSPVSIVVMPISVIVIELPFLFASFGTGTAYIRKLAQTVEKYKVNQKER
jgi:hypothetical protein